MRRYVQAVLLALAALILLLAFTYLFLPLSRVNAEIGRIMLKQSLTLTPEAQKSFMPGVVWNKPVISSKQGILLNPDLVSLRLRLLPLFAGRLTLGADVRQGTGVAALDYSLNGNEAISLSMDGIRLGDMAFFKTVLGGSAGGVFWSRGKLVRSPKGLNGDIKIEISELSLSEVKLGGFALPEVSGLRCQGIVRVADNRARLESLTLQGEGIYMRLSGDIPEGVNSTLNMALEIMPKPEFMEKQKLVFMLLTRFMVTPGNFRVPIRGTLLKPEII